MQAWLRHLPIPAYYKTLLWSRTMRRPTGSGQEWPYWRGVELALRGVKHGYTAEFPAADAYTLLEFGVSSGNSLELLIRYRDVLTRRIGVQTPVTCVGFDTFEGLPEHRDGDVAAPWIPGDWAADRDQVDERLRRAGLDEYELVKGLFADTLPGWADRLHREPPLFIAVDCDYYTSTIDVFEHVIPLAPTGCVFYFDDPSGHLFSDRAGELQAVREVNEGRFGDHISFTEYPLWIETRELRHYRQMYRLINLEKGGFATSHARADGGHAVAQHLL